MTPKARIRWAPMLVWTLGTLVVAGCSGTAGPEATGGGGGDDAGQSSNDAGVDSGNTASLGWSGNANVGGIFETSCSACHGTQWSSCWNVQASASEIDAEVSSGAMPRGSTLAPADKNALLAWLNGGASCSGAEPDGGGAEPDSGEVAFPVLSGEVVALPAL